MCLNAKNLIDLNAGFIFHAQNIYFLYKKTKTNGFVVKCDPDISWKAFERFAQKAGPDSFQWLCRPPFCFTYFL